MATWQSVRSYLTSHYRCDLVADGAVVKLVFDLAELRSQLVFVTWSGPDEASARWVDFHSPVGAQGAVDLSRAVSHSAEYAAGGISTFGDLVTLRVSVPIENLDRNEIEEPLNLVCVAADAIEQAVTGQDTY
ncbi:MAG: hypothetical protein ACI379_11855 [Nocardioides sp.]|uniref:hypothetical protein n=1 Tax=Nocardioides sp. TaxID=35761 RepID=UPI003F0AF48C